MTCSKIQSTKPNFLAAHSYIWCLQGTCHGLHPHPTQQVRTAAFFSPLPTPGLSFSNSKWDYPNGTSQIPNGTRWRRRLTVLGSRHTERKKRKRWLSNSQMKQKRHSNICWLNGVLTNLNQSQILQSSNQRDSVCSLVLSHSVMSNLYDLMVCSPLGSSVHGIFQARILEQVAISYSRESSWPKDQTCVSFISCIGRQIRYHCATCEANSWMNRP